MKEKVLSEALQQLRHMMLAEVLRENRTLVLSTWVCFRDKHLPNDETSRILWL